MNENLNYVVPMEEKLYLNFKDVTNITQLKDVLNNATSNMGKNYTLEENDVTFTYNNGVSLKRGRGNSYYEDITIAWSQSDFPLIFYNCPIPKKIQLKAHTTQASNQRNFSSITIKIGSSCFNLLYYLDAGYLVVEGGNEGLRYDGYPTGFKQLVPLSKKLLSINKTIILDSISTPNFMSFIGNNKKCDIIYQSLYYYASQNGGNLNCYPFYLEELNIDF